MTKSIIKLKEELKRSNLFTEKDLDKLFDDFTTGDIERCWEDLKRQSNNQDPMGQIVSAIRKYNREYFFGKK